MLAAGCGGGSHPRTTTVAVTPPPKCTELLLNRFLLSIGVLPVDERGLLIRKAKSAVGLCRDCFDALEALEPSVQTRLGESPCKPGF